MELLKLKIYIYYLSMFSKRYYEGLETIEDSIFDNLYDKAKNIAKKYNLNLSFLNYDHVSGGVKHYKPFLSIKKVYSENEVIKWKNSILKLTETDFNKELKIDGLALEIFYYKGLLMQILTRGNGYFGSSIIEKENVIDIPKILRFPITIRIRGEAFVFKNKYLKIQNNSAVNERTFVVMMLKGKTLNKKILNFNPYEDNITKFHSRKMWYRYMKIIGFNIYSLNIYNTVNIKTDGLIFKIDNLSYIRNLKNSNYYTRGLLALKSYENSKITILKDIYWQMGKTGILTPIVVFEPVILDNSKIERASISNLARFQNLKLRLNDKISVTKRGGIIPYIDKVFNTETDKNKLFEVPKICPFCKNITSVNDKFLYCKNVNCFEKIINQISFNLKKETLNISCISKETIRKLNLKNEYHIFLIDKDTFINKIGKKIGQKIYINVRKAAKNLTMKSIILTLNIAGLSLNSIKDTNLNLLWFYKKFNSNVSEYIKKNIKEILQKWSFIMKLARKKIIYIKDYQIYHQIF